MQDRFEAKYPERAWEKEINTLVGFIKSGNSTQIMGLPGVGRSNLLGLLAYNRNTRILHFGEDQGKYHFVLMNFSEVRKKNETEVLKFYFISIMDSLKERSMDNEYEKTKKLLKEALEIPDKQVLLQSLKKLIDYLSLEKNLTLIFLIDRFEDYIPYLESEFFTDLRALRNRAKYKFSVVFSTIKPIEEIIEPEMYVDFYEFLEGNNIYLPIKDEASLKFRVEFLQQNASRKLPQEKINEILNLTSGHGKLTRLSMEACLADELEGGDLTSFLLSKNKITKLILEFWNSLNPSEQKYLKYADQFIEEEYLNKVGLIHENNISIPLFKSFVLKEGDNLIKVLDQKITFDASSSEIKRGDVVLSESLTSSEFKLLKFFVENESKILGRDEIINAVWKDQSSTMGVSEQALDQLIFRLRKKIEENPNSPNHIQTVKGRGFKFTS